MENITKECLYCGDNRRYRTIESMTKHALYMHGILTE